MSKRSKNRKRQEQTAAPTVTTHDLGEGELRYTIPAEGFQKLVAIVRNGSLVWKHKDCLTNL